MTKKESTVIGGKKPKRGIFILAIFGLVSIFAASCGTTVPTIPPIALEYLGRVIDSNSQRPVAGAEVILDLQGVPPIVYTDSVGIYRFTAGITSSVSAQIRVYAPGYQVYNRHIVISRDIKTIEDIRLEPLALVSTPYLPNSTFAPEPVSTFTALPTSTLQIKTFAENCIFSETWRVHSSDTSILNSISTKPDGCYDMGSVGIFAGNSVLHILDRSKAYLLVTGMDTPIRSDSVIEFKVYVNSMYFPGIDEGPLFASFAIASAADPLSFTNTARFKLQVDRTDEKPPIVFVLADTDENNGAAIEGRHYGYGNTYAIRLELTGNVMSVFINGDKMHEMPTIPVGPKVFYIGYRLSVHSQIDMLISDLKIDGVLK